MDLEGISVWGKSGTADASALVTARDSEGNREVIRDGDHAWVVFLVGDEGREGRPKYAVAVVVDYGGSGGRVAGPIANQVIHALISEGYLAPAGAAVQHAQADRR
jgi:cell division protein FtsI/penicillin-binding protein 2